MRSCGLAAALLLYALCRNLGKRNFPHCDRNGKIWATAASGRGFALPQGCTAASHLRALLSLLPLGGPSWHR